MIGKYDEVVEKVSVFLLYIDSLINQSPHFLFLQNGYKNIAPFMVTAYSDL